MKRLLFFVISFALMLGFNASAFEVVRTVNDRAGHSMTNSPVAWTSVLATDSLSRPARVQANLVLAVAPHHSKPVGALGLRLWFLNRSLDLKAWGNGILQAGQDHPRWVALIALAVVIFTAFKLIQLSVFGVRRARRHWHTHGHQPGLSPC